MFVYGLGDCLCNIDMLTICLVTYYQYYKQESMFGCFLLSYAKTTERILMICGTDIHYSGINT